MSYTRSARQASREVTRLGFSLRGGSSIRSRYYRGTTDYVVLAAAKMPPPTTPTPGVINLQTHSSLSSCAAGCQKRCDLEETTSSLIRSYDLVAFATLATLAAATAAAVACATRTNLYHRAPSELSAPSLPSLAASTHRPPCFCVVSRVAACRCSVADASPGCWLPSCCRRLDVAAALVIC